MKRIVADPIKCMACRACEISCALAHVDTDDLVQAIAERSARPRIYIESAEEVAVPLQCRHCEDAPCIKVCPSGALSRTDEAEPVLVTQGKCIGCLFCVEACPFGVIRLARRTTADGSEDVEVVIKCDLCMDRQQQGLKPACVTACPVGALAFEEVDRNTRKARLKAAARAIAAGIAEK